MRVIPHVVTMTMSLLHPYAAVVLLHGCMLVLIDAQLGLRIGLMTSIKPYYSNAPMTS